MKPTKKQIDLAVEAVIDVLHHFVVENGEDLEHAIDSAVGAVDPTTITITHHVGCFVDSRVFMRAIRPAVVAALKELDA